MLSSLFPSYCYLCELRTNATLPLCRSCRLNLARNINYCGRCALPFPQLFTKQLATVCPKCQLRPPSFSRVIAPWLYDEHMAFLMHRWKFQGEKQLTAVLADLWLSTWEGCPNIDLIVPVPLHWRRLWHRGFNQAELLARKIQAIAPDLHNTKIDVRLVTRTKATESQSRLGSTGRSNNLNCVFGSRKKCAGKRIAIVDDVMTTGSTAEALSKCLLNAGAASVEIWCIARTPAPSQ